MTVIVHHDNCPDGWSSTYWLGKHIGPHAKIPGRWGEPPDLEAMRGEAVWLVDFCYEADQLRAIAEVCETLTIFDHHETSLEYITGAEYEPMNMLTYCELEGLGGLNKVSAVLDQEHSGIGLVSAYVRYRWGKVAPVFFNNLEDRDLWRFRYVDTTDIFAAVTSRPYTEDAWDGLCALEHEYLRAEGGAINRYRNQLVDQVAASLFTLDLRGYLIPCVSSPYAIGSDVAGALAEKSACGIGAYVILHAEHVQVGLRSRGDGPNVAQIAQQYGGGGHPKASGLRLAWHEFYEAVRP